MVIVIHLKAILQPHLALFCSNQRNYHQLDSFQFCKVNCNKCLFGVLHQATKIKRSLITYSVLSLLNKSCFLITHFYFHLPFKVCCLDEIIFLRCCFQIQANRHFSLLQLQSSEILMSQNFNLYYRKQHNSSSFELFYPLNRTKSLQLTFNFMKLQFVK